MASRIRSRPVSQSQLKQEIPQALQAKSEKRSFQDDLNKWPKVAKEELVNKKKITLQEYKLRKGVSSNTSSVTMRREAIFLDVSSRLSGKEVDGFYKSVDQVDDKLKIIDPIKDAGYRTVIKLKKQKAELNRRKEDAIIQSRLRNLEDVQFQPLLSDLSEPETLEKPQLIASRSSSLSDSSSGYSSSTSSRKLQGSCRKNNTPIDERKVVFVGRLEKETTKETLGNQFAKFGRVVKVQIHSKENGIHYGFVIYERACDAWSAVKAAGTFAQYDVRFGAHCAFFRQSDADLDGAKAK